MICKVKSYEQSAKSGGIRGITAMPSKNPSSSSVQTSRAASSRRTRQTIDNGQLTMDNYSVANHSTNMPVAGIRTIDVDSKSPERATSIAQWQRPVDTSLNKQIKNKELIIKEKE
jgi:hypothetical protein